MTTKNIIKKSNKVLRYYEEATIDYGVWDERYNMHFGYYEWGMNPFDLSSMLNRMNEEVLKRLKLHTESDALLLDLGCGVGTVSRYIAKKMPNASLYGTTISPWQIEFGDKRNKEADLNDRITLLRADYTDLPFASECAEAAFAVESACYAKGPDKADFLKELHRVLKKGGRFAIADGFLKHDRVLPFPLNKIYSKNLECWALDEFAVITRFVERLKMLGFKNIVVEDISWKVAPSVAHVPKTVLKYLWKVWTSKEIRILSEERINNVIAPILGMLMGLHRAHFGYYLVSGKKG